MKVRAATCRWYRGWPTRPSDRRPHTAIIEWSVRGHVTATPRETSYVVVPTLGDGLVATSRDWTPLTLLDALA